VKNRLDSYFQMVKAKRGAGAAVSAAAAAELARMGGKIIPIAAN